MLRQVLLAVVALATSTPAAVSAPASPYVVYEIYRARLGGPATVTVSVDVRPTDGLAVVLAAQLQPDVDGKRYLLRSIELDQLNASTRWRTYGWPAPPPSCPAACGSSDDTVVNRSTVTFRPQGRDRMFVAGPRGKTTVRSDSAHWRVRVTALGMRTVTAEQADATGAVVNRVGVEHFRSAAAPGGPYGSAAFAEVPCTGGAGVATFGSGDGYEEDLVCTNPVDGAWAFLDTTKGRKWTLSGDVVGAYTAPLRLLVLDFPKMA